MPRIVNGGWGPVRLLNGVTSTGAGAAVTAYPSQSDWGIQAILGGSTSTVSAKILLQGTLDTSSTAPTYATLATWASTAGQTSGAIVFQAQRPVGKVRARVDTLSSTSSTAPTATVWVGAGP